MEQFADPAKRTVADERETKNELAKPGLGDREPEQQLRRVGRRRSKGAGERVVGVALLFVDELATNFVPLSEVGDGLAFEGVESELLTGLRGQKTSRRRRDRSRWWR